MSRVGLLNIVIGFGVLVFAAASGGFIAFDLTQGFLKDAKLLGSWQHILMQSSHGHTNLFAIIHILFGLTIPYARCPVPVQKLQTLGLSLGTFAMGPGMMIRAYVGPSSSLDPNGILIGCGLSFALIALLSHFCSLVYRYWRF